jgi:hypothetical protein
MKTSAPITDMKDISILPPPPPWFSLRAIDGTILGYRNDITGEETDVHPLVHMRRSREVIQAEQRIIVARAPTGVPPLLISNSLSFPSQGDNHAGETLPPVSPLRPPPMAPPSSILIPPPSLYPSRGPPSVNPPPPRGSPPPRAPPPSLGAPLGRGSSNSSFHSGNSPTEGLSATASVADFVSSSPSSPTNFQSPGGVGDTVSFFV